MLNAPASFSSALPESSSRKGRANKSEDDARTSRAVAVARVICILGVVYVHAWTGLSGPAMAAGDRTAQGLLHWILSDLFGRAAVPLLSAISGWLAAGSLARRSAASFLRGKARTVLLPLVLWNGIAIVLVGGAAYLGWIKGPVPSSWSWVVNELTCLVHPADINVQTPFLRDLFLCLMLAPLLRRTGGAGLVLVLAVALGWSLSNINFPLLLRPPILLFFVVGLAARGLDGPRRIASLPILALAVPYLALALAHTAISIGPAANATPRLLQAAADLAMRAAAAMFFWSLAWRIAGGRLAAWFLKLEPYAFLLFCFHLILLWLAGPMIGRLTGPLGSALYPLFLLAQPLLALAASVALGRALARWAPQVAGLLSGGRLARGLEPGRAKRLNQPDDRIAPAPSRGSAAPAGRGPTAGSGAGATDEGRGARNPGPARLFWPDA